VISGEDKSVLPGVNVIIKNTGMGTVTDINGDFNLTVPENQNEVVFNFIGFHATEQTVSNSDSNVTVVLIPDVTAQLSEVVVTGQDRQEKKAITSVTQAKPLAGYSSYKNYLKKNLQYPQAARENNIEGVVNVSFEVNPDSELQRFSVEKPLGYGCDEEAIRLIKEGPAWQAALEEGKAVIQSVTVKVRFSLKD
jgi:TonB family protein